jgi:hypothetical protein
LDLQLVPPTASFSISFEMTGFWYGHGELIHQLYPLNRLMLPESPFQSFDNGPAGQSCKPNPAWFSSKGISIVAHTLFQWESTSRLIISRTTRGVWAQKKAPLLIGPLPTPADKATAC